MLVQSISSITSFGDRYSAQKVGEKYARRGNAEDAKMVDEAGKAGSLQKNITSDGEYMEYDYSDIRYFAKNLAANATNKRLAFYLLKDIEDSTHGGWCKETMREIAAKEGKYAVTKQDVIENLPSMVAKVDYNV